MSGALTLETAKALLDALAPMLARGELDTLDVSAASVADSAALAFVFACRRRAQARGHGLRIAALPPALQALAALYGVDALIAA